MTTISSTQQQHTKLHADKTHDDDDDAAVPSLEQLQHDELLAAAAPPADDAHTQQQSATQPVSCVIVHYDHSEQTTSADHSVPPLTLAAGATAAASAAAALTQPSMSYSMDDDKYRSLLSAKHRLAHSPALSESDDELDYSSASEHSAGSSSSAGSASSSAASSASPPTTSSSSPQPPSQSPARSYSPPKLHAQPAALIDLELVIDDQQKQQHSSMIVPSPDAANNNPAAGAVGNEVIPRISLEQERVEQEKQDHEFALALQAQLQNEVGAPARASPAAEVSPTSRRYPAPRPDGEYEHKAEDWRVRYARDLQMGAKIAARSSWETRVQEVAARIERGQANSDSDSSASSSDSEVNLDTEFDPIRIAPKRAPMPTAVVPVAPALLPSGIARSLAQSSRASLSNAQIGRKQKSSRWGRHGRYSGGELDDELASSSPPPPPVMATCGICQDEVSQHSTKVFGRQLGADGNIIQARNGVQCSHAFCIDCLKAYLQHEINDGKVLKLRCPGRSASNEPCGCIAPSGWVSQMVGRELYAKYERFLKLKADDSFRSCPNAKCMHVQQKSSVLALAGNQMVCEACHTEYCFLHDLAHVGSSCSAYQKRLASESKESLAHIASSTIRCPWPTCRTRCIKSSGCNHMTCSRCSTEFCYLCGGFYLGGLHFAGFNLIGCPGMKGEDAAAGSRNTVCRMALRWLIGFPLMIALFLVAFALFLAVEAVYLVWLFGLSPIWIVWGIGLCVHKRRTRGQRGYQDRKWERRYGACIGWGIYLIGGLC